MKTVANNNSSSNGNNSSAASSNTSSSASSAKTLNREEKLIDLKKKLAWTCCENLLLPPIQKLTRPEFQASDTAEERTRKQDAYAIQSRAIELERGMREGELLQAFEGIIERVKSATHNFADKNFSYTAVSEAYRSTRVFCNRCNSEVRLPVLVELFVATD
jgi:hypothetical protein